MSASADLPDLDLSWRMRRIEMKQENLAVYLRRALHHLRRGVEIGLFTHTPCPSAVVAEQIVRENESRNARTRATEKPAGAPQQPSARGPVGKAKSGRGKGRR
jgi:hypothetical protein